MGSNTSAPVDDEAPPPIEPAAEISLANEELEEEEEATAPQDAEAIADDTDADDNVDKKQGGSDAEQDERHSCCYKCCSVCCCLTPCCLTLPKKWPRVFGIIMGIVFPLFSLIAVSLLFGFGLASLEAPGEVETNNEIIATSKAVDLQADLVAAITEELPTICSSAFWVEQAVELPFKECLASNQTATDLLDNGAIAIGGNSTGNGTDPNCTEPASLESNLIQEVIQEVFVSQLAQCSWQNDTSRPDSNVTANISLPTELTIKKSDLMAAMTECGQEALQIVAEYKFEDIVDPELVASSVSFNWIRCTAPDPNANDLGGAIGGVIGDFFNPLMNTSQYLPSVQEEAVMNAWKKSQEELYCQYLDQSTAGGTANMTFDEFAAARLDALERSYIDADGFSICTVNYFAGAWFWFTIMTTVGYGNTAPTTDGGRAMVFTLGFLSILLFAGILANAGGIVTAIVDDGIDRANLSKLNRPWASALFWGSLYYLWMVLIASYYQWWQEDRLEDAIDFADSYWFSYISTTTVGLGDYYLEHGVIIGQDLLVWPLLFLFGFVLLSSFLTKIAEFLASFFPSDKPTFAENLADADVPLFPCLKRHHTVRGSAIEDEVEEDGGDEEGDVAEE